MTAGRRSVPRPTRKEQPQKAMQKGNTDALFVTWVSLPSPAYMSPTPLDRRGPKSRNFGRCLARERLDAQIMALQQLTTKTGQGQPISRGHAKSWKRLQQSGALGCKPTAVAHSLPRQNINEEMAVGRFVRIHHGNPARPQLRRCRASRARP